MTRVREGAVSAADDHFRGGRFGEAMAVYQEALRGDPRNPALLERLGVISLYENRAEASVRWLEEALARRSRLKRHWPLTAGIKTKLAMAYYRMDRFPEAAKLFSEASGPGALGPFKQLAGLARHLAVFADNTPYQMEGADATRLEFVVTDPLPVVRLSVNGRPPAPFIIDTGGAEIILDQAFAVDVGAEIVSTLVGEGAGRKRAKMGLGRVASVQAEGIRVDQVPIHTLNLAEISRHSDMDIKGILGTRFLMHFLSTIDYIDGELVLRRDLSGTRTSQRPGCDRRAETIPFWLVDTHMMLARGTLNGLPPTLFFVDTGLAGKGFLASEAMMQAAGVAVDWTEAHEGPGLGGMATETDVVIDTVTLGEDDRTVTHHDVAGAVHKKTLSMLGAANGFEVGGLISHSFFREHALTLDFGSMELVVESSACDRADAYPGRGASDG